MHAVYMYNFKKTALSVASLGVYIRILGYMSMCYSQFEIL